MEELPIQPNDQSLLDSIMSYVRNESQDSSLPLAPIMNLVNQYRQIDAGLGSANGNSESLVNTTHILNDITDLMTTADEVSETQSSPEYKKYFDSTLDESYQAMSIIVREIANSRGAFDKLDDDQLSKYLAGLLAEMLIPDCTLKLIRGIDDEQITIDSLARHDDIERYVLSPDRDSAELPEEYILQSLSQLNSELKQYDGSEHYDVNPAQEIVYNFAHAINTYHAAKPDNLEWLKDQYFAASVIISASLPVSNSSIDALSGMYLLGVMTQLTSVINSELNRFSEKLN